MRRGGLMRVVLAGLGVLAIAGCGTSFRENHYFSSASDNPSREGKTNYFRVTVDGWAAFSAARYVSGYYDERAIDLFFNEVKPAAPGVIIPPVFTGESAEPFTGDKI